MAAEERKTYTHEEWLAEANRRFGSDPMKWRFVCPSCGHVTSIQDWKDAGAPEGAVAFSCVGRWNGHMDKDAFATKGGSCNYAGGGLIGLNPVTVVDKEGQKHEMFDFAEA